MAGPTDKTNLSLS